MDKTHYIVKLRQILMFGIILEMGKAILWPKKLRYQEYTLSLSQNIFSDASQSTQVCLNGSKGHDQCCLFHCWS